jgi:cyclophilin family peptidyl-prolyl cis-trans isomerase/HEAT repeat protein
MTDGWTQWAKDASKEDIRAMLRLLEDKRADADGVRRLLGHPHQDIRGFAVLALSRMAETLDDALVGCLDDPHEAVRRTTAFALGQIGVPEGEKPLLARLRIEESSKVRTDIWKALGRCGTTVTLSQMATMKKLHPNLVQAGGLILSRLKADTASHDFIKTALKSSDLAVVAAGFYALSRSRMAIPDQYMVRAAKALETRQHADIRRACIKLLSKGAGKAGAQVFRLVKNQPFSGHERAALIQGLAKVESPRTSRRLLQLLRREVRQLRSRDAWLSDSIHPAMELARSLASRPPDKFVRPIVIQVEGWVPRHSELPAVQRRLDALHCELSAALRRVDKACLEARAVHVKARLQKKSYDFDADWASPKADVRMAALRAVSETLPEVFTERLGAALTDQDLVVLATAVDLALTKKLSLKPHQEQLVKAWHKAWKTQDIEVLLTLISAFKGIDSPQTKEQLQQATSSEQWALRTASLKALGQSSVTDGFRKKRFERVPGKDLLAPYASRAIPGWRSVTVTTDIGVFKVSFLRAFAPLTSQKIGALLEKKFYQGLGFHRVVPNFVVQGGDPRGDGWGGPGYTMRCENNPIDYKVGTVGMALAGKDTGGSQFFVALDEQPHLLGTYTVFGHVSEGMDVIRSLVPGDTIQAVELKR